MSVRSLFFCCDRGVDTPQATLFWFFVLAAFELLLIGKVMITILKFLVVDRPSYTGKMPAYASALAPYCARVFGPPSTESTVDPDKMFDVSGCGSCLMLFSGQGRHFQHAQCHQPLPGRLALGDEWLAL